jgi:hypothetical protein
MCFLRIEYFFIKYKRAIMIDRGFLQQRFTCQLEDLSSANLYDPRTQVFVSVQLCTICILGFFFN